MTAASDLQGSQHLHPRLPSPASSWRDALTLVSKSLLHLSRRDSFAFVDTWSDISFTVAHSPSSPFRRQGPPHRDHSRPRASRLGVHRGRFLPGNPPDRRRLILLAVNPSVTSISFETEDDDETKRRLTSAASPSIRRIRFSRAPSLVREGR